MNKASGGWSAEELGQGRPGRAARGPAYLHIKGAGVDGEGNRASE